MISFIHSWLRVVVEIFLFEAMLQAPKSDTVGTNPVSSEVNYMQKNKHCFVKGKNGSVKHQF